MRRKIINSLLAKNLNTLKITMLLIVIFVIAITNFTEYFYLNDPLPSVIFDSAVELILTLTLSYLAFNLIKGWRTDLNNQLNQLAEAYQYIGRINRQIDSLLEVDIASLDHSRSQSPKNSHETIFNQLLNLLGAKAGLLHIDKPEKIKILSGKNQRQPDEKVRVILENLHAKVSPEFQNSQNPDHLKRFISLGVSPAFFEKYHLITKPVYMHSNNIGRMLIVLDKDSALENRDLNIIRVYSFYLALNATFQPAKEKNLNNPQ